jgi:hypothetical protein
VVGNPTTKSQNKNGAGEQTPKRTKSRSQVAEHGEAHEIAPQGGNLTLPRGGEEIAKKILKKVLTKSKPFAIINTEQRRAHSSINKKPWHGDEGTI